MISTLSIRKDSIQPKLVANIIGNDGTAVALTGATGVKFTMYNSSTPVIDAVAGTIEDVANGQVSYTWVSGDTDTAGTYYAYFDVTMASGTMIAPSRNEFIIEIVDTE